MIPGSIQPIVSAISIETTDERPVIAGVSVISPRRYSRFRERRCASSVLSWVRDELISWDNRAFSLSSSNFSRSDNPVVLWLDHDGLSSGDLVIYRHQAERVRAV